MKIPSLLLANTLFLSLQILWVVSYIAVLIFLNTSKSYNIDHFLEETVIVYLIYTKFGSVLLLLVVVILLRCHGLIHRFVCFLVLYLLDVLLTLAILIMCGLKLDKESVQYFTETSVFLGITNSVIIAADLTMTPMLYCIRKQEERREQIGLSIFKGRKTSKAKNNDVTLRNPFVATPSLFAESSVMSEPKSPTDEHLDNLTFHSSSFDEINIQTANVSDIKNIRPRPRNNTFSNHSSNGMRNAPSSSSIIDHDGVYLEDNSNFDKSSFLIAAKQINRSRKDSHSSTSSEESDTSSSLSTTTTNLSSQQKLDKKITPFSTPDIEHKIPMLLEVSNIEIDNIGRQKVTKPSIPPPEPPVQHLQVTQSKKPLQSQPPDQTSQIAEKQSDTVQSVQVAPNHSVTVPALTETKPSRPASLTLPSDRARSTGKRKSNIQKPRSPPPLPPSPPPLPQEDTNRTNYLSDSIEQKDGTEKAQLFDLGITNDIHVIERKLDDQELHKENPPSSAAPSSISLTPTALDKGNISEIDDVSANENTVCDSPSHHNSDSKRINRTSGNDSLWKWADTDMPSPQSLQSNSAKETRSIAISQKKDEASQIMMTINSEEQVSEENAIKEGKPRLLKSISIAK